MQIAYQKRELRKLFDNRERETSYRIAQNAYFWGDFYRTRLNNQLPNGQTRRLHCKLCREPHDNPTHDLTTCPVSKQTNAELTDHYNAQFATTTTITKEEILHGVESRNNYPCLLYTSPSPRDA